MFKPGLKRIGNPRNGFRKVVPYNVNFKKIYLMMLLALGLAPTFTSCEKDDSKPYDPIAEQLKTLRIDSTRLAGEVRAAVLPAKTVDYDISSYFDMLLDRVKNQNYNGKLTNISDSSKAFKDVVNTAREENGNPLPYNNATMSDLYNTSDSFLSTVEVMDSLLHRTR